MQSLIGKYPPHRCLDRVLPGQEDEATPDPDGVPWETEEPVDCRDDKSEGDPGEILDYDPADWVNPSGSSHHGNGGGDDAASSESPGQGHGGGDATAADGERDDHGDGGGSLSAEQVSTLHEHSSRLQSLQEAKSILEGLGGALGAQLTTTVD